MRKGQTRKEVVCKALRDIPKGSICKVHKKLYNATLLTKYLKPKFAFNHWMMIAKEDVKAGQLGWFYLEGDEIGIRIA